jgi:hypothetical protein
VEEILKLWMEGKRKVFTLKMKSESGMERENPFRIYVWRKKSEWVKASSFSYFSFSALSAVGIKLYGIVEIAGDGK